MAEALKLVAKGQTYLAVAETCKVNHSTLHRRATQGIQKVGRPLALTPEEESVIFALLCDYTDRGIPLTQTQLQDAISIFVRSMDKTRRLLLPFTDERPGRAFFRAFHKCHTNRLFFTKPLGKEAERMLAMNAETLTTHFAIVKKQIRDNGIDADLRFDLDEAGTTPDRELTGISAGKRLMSREGSQNCTFPSFKDLHRVTIMPVISGSRRRGPALFVGKGPHLPCRTVTRGDTV